MLNKVMSWITNLFAGESVKEKTKPSLVIVYEETNELPPIRTTIKGKKEQAWKDDIWKNRWKAD